MLKMLLKFVRKSVITILFAQELLSFGPCPEGYNGNVRNPLNCSTYYSCTPYGPQIMPCPDNLCYNEDLDWCDWCNEVPACLGGEIDPICELPLNSLHSYPIFFKYSGNDCGTFYFCNMSGKFDGVGYCAKGLWFDFEIQGCIEPWSGHCHFK